MIPCILLHQFYYSHFTIPPAIIRWYRFIGLINETLALNANLFFPWMTDSRAGASNHAQSNTWRLEGIRILGVVTELYSIREFRNTHIHPQIRPYRFISISHSIHPYTRCIRFQLHSFSIRHTRLLLQLDHLNPLPCNTHPFSRVTDTISATEIIRLDDIERCILNSYP